MKFQFSPTALPEVVLIEHERFGDDRGSFAETFRAEPFAAHGIPELVQENESRSVRHVLRGLHFQNEPAAQGKLVRCTAGRIFDVAVDLRRGSPSYGRWTAVELEGTDNRMLWIPPGFAHGFCTVSDSAHVIYKTSAYYAPEHDRGIAWNDPEIGIEWPTDAPILSAKDSGAPALGESDHNFVYPHPRPTRSY